ncbi:MAG: hypothetical protein ABI844_16665 [Saprospiraceae bacterium]
MIESLRNQFNASFTHEKYEAYLHKIEELTGEEPHFRVAETPIFIPDDLKGMLLRACDDLIDFIVDKDFYAFSEKSIPAHQRFPNDPKYSPFLIFDFGVCENEKGEIVPQLIEMQGFPSLYAFMLLKARACREVFHLPDHLTSLINTSQLQEVEDLKKIIIADADPAEVILLDHLPEEQKTKVDFAATKKLLGIETVCVTKLKQDGRMLYYEKDGKKQKISRIYNRLIFDEFFAKKIESIDLTQDLDVTWLPHPNWYYRVSKYLLPYIKSDFVPETICISDLKTIPDNLNDYVLKPLYSYAGMGVVIDVKKEDIENIKEPHEWILQKKVHYIPAIKTLNIPTKAEIRMMAIWEGPEQRPRVVQNLVRLSKGKMIGVRYNADFDWVGSSICFFES